MRTFNYENWLPAQSVRTRNNPKNLGYAETDGRKKLTQPSKAKGQNMTEEEKKKEQKRLCQELNICLRTLLDSEVIYKEENKMQDFIYKKIVLESLLFMLAQ